MFASSRWLRPRDGQVTVICVNGNESPGWQDEKISARTDGSRIRRGGDRPARRRGSATRAGGEGPRLCRSAGRGRGEHRLQRVPGGPSLLGLRVSDVLLAVQKAAKRAKRQRLVLCGRRDAALVASSRRRSSRRCSQWRRRNCVSASCRSSTRTARPINAASILPGLLRDFGDVADLLGELARRKVLIAAGVGKLERKRTTVQIAEGRFSEDPRVLTEWLPQ